MDLQGNKSRTAIRETVNADTARPADASGAGGRKCSENKAVSDPSTAPGRPAPRPSCPAASRNRSKDGPRSTLQVVFLLPLIGLKSQGFEPVGDGMISPATRLRGLGRRSRPEAFT